jgi:hypothetical protein
MPKSPPKLYNRKTPITAAEILNDRVAPFYHEYGIRLSRMLTDRATEFCGAQSTIRALPHDRGHRLQPHQDQEPAKERNCERFHRTILEEAPDRVPQEDLSHDRRAAGRSRHLAGRLQLSAAEIRARWCFWPDSNADLS